MSDLKFGETIHPGETIVDFMLRAPQSFKDNLYLFPAMSDKGKALFKAFDWGNEEDDDPRYMLPVVEVEKLMYPFDWCLCGRKAATARLATLRLAYLLGKMDGKAEEREHHRNTT